MSKSDAVLTVSSSGGVSLRRKGGSSEAAMLHTVPAGAGCETCFRGGALAGAMPRDNPVPPGGSKSAV